MLILTTKGPNAFRYWRLRSSLDGRAGNFFAALFGDAVPRSPFVAEIPLQVKRRDALAELRALHVFGIIVFNAAPKSQFQLRQLDELIVVVALEGKNNVQYDVVVFI